jgi:hypothetical protein
MTTATERQAKKANLFDEDITSLYTLDLPPPRYRAYAMDGVEITNGDEQYMLDAFHQQYVAVEGRTAIAKLIDTRIGEIATHTTYVMGTTTENVARIEAATPTSRLTKMQHNFNDQVMNQAGRYMLETNAIAYRTMHEDMRRSVYKPPPPPPKPRWKGLIPLVVEFFVGES